MWQTNDDTPELQHANSHTFKSAHPWGTTYTIHYIMQHTWPVEVQHSLVGDCLSLGAQLLSFWSHILVTQQQLSSAPSAFRPYVRQSTRPRCHGSFDHPTLQISPACASALAYRNLWMSCYVNTTHPRVQVPPGLLFGRVSNARDSIEHPHANPDSIHRNAHGTHMPTHRATVMQAVLPCCVHHPQPAHGQPYPPLFYYLHTKQDMQLQHGGLRCASVSPNPGGPLHPSM